MKLLVVVFILTSISMPSYGCWNSANTCVNGTTTAGQACKSPGVTPKVCFISLVTSTGNCWIIYNSTGKDVFIPTKTAGAFATFVANHPGLTVTSGTAGTNCFPSCRMIVGTCPSPQGSTTNPP